MVFFINLVFYVHTVQSMETLVFSKIVDLVQRQLQKKPSISVSGCLKEIHYTYTYVNIYTVYNNDISHLQKNMGKNG